MRTAFKKAFRVVKRKSAWRKWYKRTASRSYRRHVRLQLRVGEEDVPHIPDRVRLDAWEVS